MKYSILFINLLILFSCQQEGHKIIDKPIIFNEERNQLTLEYLSSHYNLIQDKPTITPKMIVLHWTHIPTLDKSFNAFKNIHLPNSRAKIKTASNLNVSAHFLVDQDGTIYRLMSETTMARHVIGLNHCAIGIENVGGDKNTPLTQAQIDANIYLVNYLLDTYDIQYLIGHYEYTQFENNELWLEKDAGYRTIKTDPGAEFMHSVRSATKHHNFKENPINKQ
ncbi:MAG: peptidoglycan recognition family protein [Flavobacteriaceae bacterium]